MILQLISVVIVIAIIIFMKKHLSLDECFFLYIFGVGFYNTVNIFTNIKYELYGYFKKGVDFDYLPSMFILYPLLTIIISNYFPYNKGWFKKIMYILMWVIISTIYEYIALHTEYLYYNHWKLWYSIIVYPFLFSIILRVL